MTRWAIPAFRCDRCGVEIEERDSPNPARASWATISASAPGPNGRLRTIGDMKAPGDLCGACAEDLFRWFGEVREPVPPPSAAPAESRQRMRAALSLADRQQLAAIVLEAMSDQVAYAARLFLDTVDIDTLMSAEGNLPNMMTGSNARATDAARQIVERFDLAKENEVRRAAEEPPSDEMMAEPL